MAASMSFTAYSMLLSSYSNNITLGASDSVEAPPEKTRELDNSTYDGYASWAYNEMGEERLWQDRLEMVRLNRENVCLFFRLGID